MGFMDTAVGEWVIIGLSAMSFIIAIKLLVLGTPLKNINSLAKFVASA